MLWGCDAGRWEGGDSRVSFSVCHQSRLLKEGLQSQGLQDRKGKGQGIPGTGG